MATARPSASRFAPETGFFFVMAIVMTVINVAAFGLFAAMGISSFGAPLYVHIHAVIFFGWVTLYMTQNALAATGSIALHRRLGWVGVAWVAAMVVVGTVTTILSVRRGATPFIFTPSYFLIMNPVNVATFAALVFAGVAVRRNTGWHRRLIYCAMATILGPALGRLLPPPVLIAAGIPTVVCILLGFVAAGAIRDWRVYGRVHPAWVVGAAAQIAMWSTISLIAHSALGVAIYDRVVAGSPGAARPALVKPIFPG